VGLGLLFLLPFPETLEVCILCALAMPLGLNTVVIPAAYGRNTSQAAGMALVSHMLSCFTIPLMFLLLQFVI
jgi:predicted permease